MGVEAAAIGGGLLLGGAIQGYFGNKASNEQIAASEDQLQMQLDYANANEQQRQDWLSDWNNLNLQSGAWTERSDIANQQMDDLRATMGQQEGAVTGAYDSAYGDLSSAYQAGLGRIDAGVAGATGAIQQGTEAGAAAIQGAQTDALNYLSGGYGQARGDVTRATAGAFDLASQGYAQGAQQLGGLAGLGRYGEMAAQSVGNSGRLGGLDLSRQGTFGGFDQDPGYQYRLAQSEEAIGRAASARGGRLGGRALQELQQNAQGLAGQAYEDFANRNLALNQQQIQRGGQVDANRLSADLAAQQNQMTLGQTGYGAQSNLANLYAQQGSQLAGYQLGQGQQLAGMSQQLGQEAAGISQGAGQSLAEMYQQAGLGQADVYSQAGTAGGALAAQSGQQLAGLTSQQGANLSNLYGEYGQQLAGLAAENSYANDPQLAYYNQMNDYYTRLTGGFTMPGSNADFQAPAQNAGAGTAAWGNAAGQTANNLMQMYLFSQMGGFQ